MDEKLDAEPIDPHINFVPVRSQLGWDEYFLLQAMLASFRSKDPNTKVGCVFVDQHNHQISMGYNGTIAGIDERQIPWGNDRRVPLEYQKYGYVMHAEANALSHATRSLAGSRAYVTLFPCNECAKLIAARRVSEVIFLSDKYAGTQENRIAKKIFDLSNISYRPVRMRTELVKQLSEYLESMLEADDHPAN